MEEKGNPDQPGTDVVPAEEAQNEEPSNSFHDLREKIANIGGDIMTTMNVEGVRLEVRFSGSTILVDGADVLDASERALTALKGIV